jgi:hypothetical protein
MILNNTADTQMNIGSSDSSYNFTTKVYGNLTANDDKITVYSTIDLITAPNSIEFRNPGGAIFKNVIMEFNGGNTSRIVTMYNNTTIDGNLTLRNNFSGNGGISLMGYGSPIVAVIGNFDMPYSSANAGFNRFGDGGHNLNFRLGGNLTVGEYYSAAPTTEILLDDITFNGTGNQAVNITPNNSIVGTNQKSVFIVNKDSGAVAYETGSYAQKYLPWYINKGELAGTIASGTITSGAITAYNHFAATTDAVFSGSLSSNPSTVTLDPIYSNIEVDNPSSTGFTRVASLLGADYKAPGGEHFNDLTLITGAVGSGAGVGHVAFYGNASTSDIDLYVDGTFKVDRPAGATNTLYVDGSANKPTLQVYDAVFTGTSGTFSVGSAYGMDINISNDFTLSYANGSINNTTLKFNGADEQLFTYTAGTIHATSSLVVDKPSGTLKFMSDNKTSNASLTVSSGTLDPNGNTFTVYQKNISIGADGVIQGKGTIGITQDVPKSYTFTNNGKVIADGGGADSTLTINTTGAIKNTFDNTGDSGWYALNKGMLALPGQSITTGSNKTVYWGEEADADALPDMVNSAKLTFNNVSSVGTFSINLMASDRSDIEVSLDNQAYASYWDVNFTGAFNYVDMIFKYDDSMVQSLGIEESTLKFYHFTGGEWVDVTTQLDTENNLLYASNVTSFSDFSAQGNITANVPEPATMVSLLSGLAMIGFRRVHRSGKK